MFAKALLRQEIYDFPDFIKNEPERLCLFSSNTATWFLAAFDLKILVVHWSTDGLAGMTNVI